jgi:hypothetical protein
MVYTTIALVASYLQTTIDGSSTPSSTEVQEWIDEVEDEINHITKQQFEEITVTNQVLSANSDTSRMSANQHDRTPSWELPAGNDEIILPEQNITSLDVFEVNLSPDGVTPDWSALDIGDDGDVKLIGNRVSFLTSNFVIRPQKVSVRVSYKYGRTSVPKFVQKLATRMVALQYIQSGLANEVSGGGGSIRVGDIQITEPGRFSQEFVMQTQKDVEWYLNKLGTHNVYLI